MNMIWTICVRIDRLYQGRCRSSTEYWPAKIEHLFALFGQG